MGHLTSDTLAIILGGGQGARLFPLTATRSKPAVPIGGKYRLIDVPISGCLHADIRRIFVLTQFNSASLNRHISSTYRLDRFSGGFVEILAAEQTPDNPNWYQGTADAVRQAVRHFAQHEAEYDLILAGDHLYRMDYRDLVDAHRRQGADVTIAAQPVDADTATDMGIFRFDRDGTVVAFEEKPKAARLHEIGRSIPPGATFADHSHEQPFMASMGVYVFTRRVLLEMLERQPGHDFGRELIPHAIDTYRVKPYLFRGYWADVGTIESFYEANVMLGRLDSPFHFWDRERPIYTHLRHLPGSLVPNAQVRDSIVSEGCTWLAAGSRTRSWAFARRSGKARRSRVRCSLAPTSTSTNHHRTSRDWAWDATSSSTESSSTRTPASATAHAWSTSSMSSMPTATGTTSAAVSSLCRRVE